MTAEAPLSFFIGEDSSDSFLQGAGRLFRLVRSDPEGMQRLEVAETNLVESAILFRQKTLPYLACSESPVEGTGNSSLRVRYSEPEGTIRVGKNLVFVAFDRESFVGVIPQHGGLCRRDRCSRHGVLRLSSHQRGMAFPTGLRSEVVSPARLAARRPPSRALDPFLGSKLIRDRGRKLGECREAHKNKGDY